MAMDPKHPTIFSRHVCTVQTSILGWYKRQDCRITIKRMIFHMIQISKHSFSLLTTKDPDRGDNWDVHKSATKCTSFHYGPKKHLCCWREELIHKRLVFAKSIYYPSDRILYDTEMFELGVSRQSKRAKYQLFHYSKTIFCQKGKYIYLIVLHTTLSRFREISGHAQR